MNRKCILLFFLLCLISLEKAKGQLRLNVQTIERQSNSQEIPLGGVYIQILQAKPFRTDNNGKYEAFLNKHNKQEVTFLSFGKKGYVLCSPSPYRDFTNKSNSQELVFMKTSIVNKESQKYADKVMKANEAYFIRTTNGLYKKKEELKNQSYWENINNSNKYLLASLSGFPSMETTIADANNVEIEKIENEITALYENQELNQKRIRLLADEYAQLIPINRTDTVILYRLQRLEQGQFEDIFAEIGKESQTLLRKSNAHSPLISVGEPTFSVEEASLMIQNAKILTLGLAQDRELAEKLLDAVDHYNIYYRYEYAKFLAEYKPVEKYERIESLFKNYDLQQHPVYITVKILQLLRDMHASVTNKNKAIKVNKTILSVLKDIQNFDDFAQLNYYEAMNWSSESKRNIKSLANINLSIQGIEENNESIKLLIKNTAAMIELLSEKQQQVSVSKMIKELITGNDGIDEYKEKTYPYISILKKMSHQNKFYMTENDEMNVYLSLNNYFYTIDNKDSANYYMREFFKIIENQIALYPEVNDYKLYLCLNYYRLNHRYYYYSDISEKTDDIIKTILYSDAFGHYKAFAHYCLYVQDSDRNQLKEAHKIWDSLSRQFPNTKIYRTNRNSVAQILRFTRE